MILTNRSTSESFVLQLERLDDVEVGVEHDGQSSDHQYIVDHVVLHIYDVLEEFKGGEVVAEADCPLHHRHSEDPQQHVPNPKKWRIVS